jgi:predicted esterase YcpF (UPF0227 family)
MDDADNIMYVSDASEFYSCTTDISAEEVHNINKLAEWLPTIEKFTTTPLNDRYKYW